MTLLMWELLVQDERGHDTPWGGQQRESLFGSDGWCNAERPSFR